MIAIRIRCVHCNCLDVVSVELVLGQSGFYGLFDVGSVDSGRDMGAYLESNCDGGFRSNPFRAQCEVSDKLRFGGGIT